MERNERRDLFPGALEMMVLQTLRRGPLHGYAIAQNIRQSAGDLLQIEEGTLYPALQRLLRETGLPLAPLVCGIRQDSFENLERTLLEMEREYAEATAQGDASRARACRRAVITAKDHARFALRSPKRTADERAAKEEMVLWLLTWLENPGVFATWLELRKKAIAGIASV